MAVITRPVFIESVVLRIEGPELLLARDQVGTAYLCLLISRDDDGDRFVAVKVSDRRYAGIRGGLVDLRSAFSQPETREFFVGFFARLEGRPAIQLAATKPFGERWLPKQGLFVTDLLPAREVSQEVVSAANANGRTTIVCRLNPPEAQGFRPKIRAERLADYISGFQELVKQVFAHGKKILSAESWTLNVPAFSGGSFKIHFEAAEEQVTLFDVTAMGDAMRTIDELVDVMDQSPAEILKVAQKHRGLVVAAYRNFLEFAGEQSTPVEYEWAEPGADTVSYRKVRPETARAVCAVLDTHEDLGTETIIFVGTFFKADSRRGTWGATDEATGKRRYGSLHEDAPSLLVGAKIDVQRYTLVCEARLERTADGRSTTKIVLKDRKEAATEPSTEH